MWLLLIETREKIECCKLQNSERSVPGVQMRISGPLERAKLANQKNYLRYFLPPRGLQK